MYNKNTILLPLYSDNNFSYTTELNGVSVKLSFFYNTRTKHYHLSMALRDGTLVVEQVKLVPNVYINTSAMENNTLTGYFFLCPNNTSIPDTDSNRKSMNENYFLSYTYFTSV